MQTSTVDISVPDGLMPCYLARPDGAGPFPAVILYMDVPGIRPELHRFADRIASEAYVCVLPDLYHRDGLVRFDLSKGQAELQRMFAAGSFPEWIKASASLYGVRIVTRQDDSPHLLIPKAKAEFYFGFAAHDPYVEDFVIPELREALQNNKVRHVIEVIPGTEHGFCFPERPAYSHDAAEAVWKTAFDLYRRTLHGKF